MICTIWYVKYCHLVSQFRFNSWNIFWSSYWSLDLFFHNIHIYLLLFVNVFYVHTFTFYSCVIKRGLGNPPKSWPMRCDKQARRLIISHRGHSCLGKSRAIFVVWEHQLLKKPDRNHDAQIKIFERRRKVDWMQDERDRQMDREYEQLNDGSCCVLELETLIWNMANIL